MKLKLVISDDCQACIRVKSVLSVFVKENPSADLQIEKLSETAEKNLFIVPALFINNELFAYGDIDAGKLSEIKKLL